MLTIKFADECDVSIPLTALTGWHVNLALSAAAPSGVEVNEAATYCIETGVDNDGDLVIVEVNPEGYAQGERRYIPADSIRSITVL